MQKDDVLSRAVKADAARGGHERSVDVVPEPVPDRTRGWPAFVIAAAGGGAGITLMLALADAMHYPWGFVPFATSIVLVLGSPGAPQAQPRNIVGGHVLSALAGLIACAVLGYTTWSAALGVAVAIAAMQATRTFHPPAGISPVVIASAHAGWGFLLVPVLAGVLILVAYAWIFHRLTQPVPWPRHWTDSSSTRAETMPRQDPLP